MTSPATTPQEAQRLIAISLSTEPRLCHFGIGIYDERRVLRESGKAAVDEKLASERQRLAEAIDEVRAAADWVKGQQRSPTINDLRSSYGYKHCVERWFRTKGTRVYVANGSFIAAAIGLGWEHEISDGSPNVGFAFSEHTIRSPYEFQHAWVYFIQAGEGESSAIKIGHSTDVEKRLEQLRTGNHLPLSLLAKIGVPSVADAQDLERRLHNRFKRLRLEGEWFRWSIDLLRAAEDMER
jgi:hypothetical protein